MNERIVIPNDDTGRWDVLEDGCWLVAFESESLAREFAAVPTLLAALEEARRQMAWMLDALDRQAPTVTDEVAAAHQALDGAFRDVCLVIAAAKGEA